MAYRSERPIEPDPHVACPRRQPCWSPRRASSLEVEASEEVPGDLCRMGWVCSFDSGLPQQLRRDSVLHGGCLECSTQIAVDGAQSWLEVVGDMCTPDVRVRQCKNDVLWWVVLLGERP